MTHAAALSAAYEADATALFLRLGEHVYFEAMWSTRLEKVEDSNNARL